MKFAFHLDLLLFSDDAPGSHATMFNAAGERLSFCANDCAFDDAARDYTWAFRLTAPVGEGQRFVFATSDRVVAGLFENGACRAVLVTEPAVERENGKPVRLLDGFGAAITRALGAARTVPVASPTPPAPKRVAKPPSKPKKK